jgi:hypothetical protein
MTTQNLRFLITIQRDEQELYDYLAGVDGRARARRARALIREGYRLHRLPQPAKLDARNVPASPVTGGCCLYAKSCTCIHRR